MTAPRALFAAGLAGVLAAAALVGTAEAHGSTTDPPSRAFWCFDRWGTDFQNPAMATEDPMCWQAWQANPNAMWNWNGLNRTGAAGDHQAVVPDGQLCSGGLTKDGMFAALDRPGAWRAVTKPRQFTLTVTDGLKHGADYLRVYLTRQGFDATTQPLRWSDLQLVTATGPQTGAAGTYEAQVDAGGRTGRHVVYTIWQAAHKDESYYMCSDVIFGGSGTPTTPPTSPAITSPPSTARCSAAYSITGQWTGGFQAEVRVTAGSTAIRSWTVNWTFANGERVSSAWGATVTTSGANVTARNAGYNGSVPANGSTTFGLIGARTGSNGVPALGCSAT